MSEELVILGYINNTCRKCGDDFELPYFENETPESARKDCCVACTFGFKSLEEFGEAFVDIIKGE